MEDQPDLIDDYPGELIPPDPTLRHVAEFLLLLLILYVIFAAVSSYNWVTCRK
jgi:hypothetical protein